MTRPAPPRHRGGADPAAPEHRNIPVAGGFRLWAERIPATGPDPGEPVLLVAGANASSRSWPDELVARLARRHPVLRWDHRDTGRSTGSAADDGAPYALADLAPDAVAVLDAFATPRAHVVGMGMGGLLAQLLLLDHPDRLASANLVCTGPLPVPGAPAPPGPAEPLLRLWAELDDPRDPAGELAFRVEHWRLLHGTGSPFDEAAFRALEEAAIAHAGTSQTPTAHARMSAEGIERGAELAGVRVPTLVVEGPEDPACPPPNAPLLATALGGARLVSIPGMGHAVGPTVVGPLAAAILTRTAPDGPGRPR